MRYSGAEIVVKALERQGIKIIAGIPGGANLPIYNALYKSSIRHILARHEQGQVLSPMEWRVQLERPLYAWRHRDQGQQTF